MTEQERALLRTYRIEDLLQAEEPLNQERKDELLQLFTEDYLSDTMKGEQS
jgi:hypothetical protein